MEYSTYIAQAIMSAQAILETEVETMAKWDASIEASRNAMTRDILRTAKERDQIYLGVIRRLLEVLNAG